LSSYNLRSKYPAQTSIKRVISIRKKNEGQEILIAEIFIVAIYLSLSFTQAPAKKGESPHNGKTPPSLTVSLDRFKPFRR